MTATADGPDPLYAIAIADASYDWYRAAAIRAKRIFRYTELASLGLSASIPVVVVLLPTATAIPAVIGSLLVVLAGLRNILHSQENYLRYSRAREGVEAERRCYRTFLGAYADTSKRDQLLVERVTAIEHGEMTSWIADTAKKRHHVDPGTHIAVEGRVSP